MKKIRRYVVSLLIMSLCFLANSFPVQKVDAMTMFKDVPPGSWAIPAIRYGVDHQYISGMSKLIFGYGEKLTREQAATIITKAYFDGSVLPFIPSFTDAKYSPQRYYIAALEEAQIRGYADGTFHPKATITRAEFAAMLTK